ncbi:MAG: hypothetical protein HY673_08845 [Chloroflexi bacterium]|nr:hypothetical protein [Chloroflexota bacterium]
MNETSPNKLTLEVYDPTGAVEVTRVHAPRLADLNGKTICEISNDSWDYYRTFPLIRELLRAQFHDLKIIPYTEFPHGVVNIDAPDIGDLVKAGGGQAAIVGNAG